MDFTVKPSSPTSNSAQASTPKIATTATFVVTTTTAAVNDPSSFSLMGLDYADSEDDLVELTLNFTDILNELDDDKIVSQKVGEVKIDLDLLVLR